MKKEKEISERRKKFNELWANKQTHAIIVLGLWMSFFLLIFIILGILSLISKNDNNSNVVEKEKLGLVEILNNLNYSNYSFEYNVTHGEEKYSYSGEKKDGIVNGYFEKGDTIIKYAIEDGITYKVSNGEKNEDTTIMDSSDNYFLNIVNIENLLRYYSSFQKYDKNKYIYDIKNGSTAYYFEFLEDENDNINDIKIIVDDYTYDMKYKNIEKVVED